MDINRLIARTRQGLTTEQDAQEILCLVKRLEHYERALRQIATYGGGGSSKIAACALEGRAWVEDYGEEIGI
jgi:hypothetical protein